MHADNETDSSLLLLYKNRLHEALEYGQYASALQWITSYPEEDLIKCYENYRGYSPPSYKSCLHIIVALRDKQTAVILCLEFLARINSENRDKLLAATVVEQFGTDRVRVAAMHIAAYSGNVGVVTLLSKEQKVNVNCSTSEIIDNNQLKGITPLYWAAVNGHREVVKLLIDIIGDVNASCSDNAHTPLYIACSYGHSALVQWLLANQADVNASRTVDGSTPLHVAAQNGHVDVVKLLLERNADVNASRTVDGSTPLYVAAWNGHVNVVKLLLQRNADVNVCCTDDALTPLHVAAKKGYVEMTKLLLDNNANRRARCHNGDTPRKVAQQNHHLDILKLL